MFYGKFLKRNKNYIVIKYETGSTPNKFFLYLSTIPLSLINHFFPQRSSKLNYQKVKGQEKIEKKWEKIK